jgi:hypothetical protein
MLPLVSADAATAPNGREYEMVSPVEKNNGDVFPNLVFGSDSLLISSTTPLREDDPYNQQFQPYVASRTSTMWQLRTGYIAAHFKVVDVNADASQEIIDLDNFCFPCQSLAPGDTDTVADVYTRRGSDVKWVSQGSLGGNSGERPTYAGQSADGSHVLFETTEQLEPADIGRTSGYQLYDRVGDETKVVGVDSDENLVSDGGAVLGNGASAGPPYDDSSGSSDAVSADGSRIFFESPDPGTGGNTQLYVRVNDADTIEVSASQCDRQTPAPPCEGPQPVTFQGASDDGSVVFFTTAGQLVDEDTDSGIDLYRYDLATSDLTLISDGCVGPGQVSADCSFTEDTLANEGVSAVADDGARVYFLSNRELWVYDRQQPPARAIAPTPEATRDLINGGLTQGAYSLAASSDGGTLVFASADQLTSFDNTAAAPGLCANSNQRCAEIYRYVAATDTLDCVSCNRTATAPRGDADVSGAIRTGSLAGARRPNRVVSADGGVIAFVSKDGLIPQDANGEDDVYEWNHGTLSLITSGADANASRLGGLSADGRDLFFSTYDPMVPTDVDFRSDVYDARIGGGFPVPPKQPAPCAGDLCQPTSDPPTLGDSASTTFRGSGDLNPPARPMIAARNLTKAQRERLARTGKATLGVRVNRPGTLRMVARANLSGHQRIVGSARIRTSVAKLIRVHLELSHAARRQVASGHRLLLRITLSFHGRSVPLRIRLG